MFTNQYYLIKITHSNGSIEIRSPGATYTTLGLYTEPIAKGIVTKFKKKPWFKDAVVEMVAVNIQEGKQV